MVKAVIIGQGEVGKTTLLLTAMAREPVLTEADARTIGVDIEQWRPEGDGDAKAADDVPPTAMR